MDVLQRTSTQHGGHLIILRIQEVNTHARALFMSFEYSVSGVTFLCARHNPVSFFRQESFLFKWHCTELTERKVLGNNTNILREVKHITKINSAAVWKGA